MKDLNCRKVVKNLSITQEGKFSSLSKIIDNKQIEELMKEVEKQITKTADNIYLGQFGINPKSYSSVKRLTKKQIEEGITTKTFSESKNIGCEFCEYHDLCYMTNENLVEIKGGEDDE